MNTTDDVQIVNLLFERQENGLIRMEEKYSNYCYSIANRISGQDCQKSCLKLLRKEKCKEKRRRAVRDVVR